MSDTQDRVSPAFVGEDRITVTIDEDSFLAGSLVTERTITARFDYSGAEPEGVALPIIVELQPGFGDGDAYRRLAFKRFTPETFAFKVTGAGKYFILVKERFHNQWQGRLEIEVEGDPFSDVQISQRTA